MDKNKRVREAYFSQKTMWNANCDFDVESDKFILRSATSDPIHAEIENEKYELFKAGFKAGFCQGKVVDMRRVLK